MRVNRSIRITVDPRDKITTGYKGEDGLPKKAQHFVLQHPETGEVYFPELIEAYGEKPDTFTICFPTDNIEDIFNDDFNLWNKTNSKTRTCNGDVCTHILDESIQGKKYPAGSQTECVCEKHGLRTTEDKELKKLACKCDMYLKAYIFNPKTGKILNPLPYLFLCHSTNSADNIYSMLSRIKNLKGIPFELSVKYIKREKRAYTIWNIVPVIVPENLLEYQMDRLPEPEVKRLSEPNEEAEITEENIDTETGEAINSNTLFTNDFVHLQGHVKRIQSCTSNKSADEAYALMIKNNGLKKEEKEFLLNIVASHKEFMRSVAEREKE